MHEHRLIVVSASSPDAMWRRAAGWSALMALAMCLFIITLLVMTLREQRRLTPLNSPQLAVMKARLEERPNDEALKTHIRERDAILRRGYFSRMAFVQYGAWLLVGAGAALAMALKSYHAASANTPRWSEAGNDPCRENSAARWGVGASAVLLAGVAGALAWSQRPQVGATVQQVVQAEPPADAQTLARNWVSFRGFAGDGIVAAGTVPESWDGTTGQGILWKVAVPLPGNSSPVVFGDNVFVSGSSGDTQEVFCFETQNGQLKWRGNVPRGTLQKPNIFDDTGFASPTPVTDGVRVYALFAGGDIAAFDYSGKQLWSRTMGAPESQYGYASSLALYNGRVIVQWDQGSSEEDGKSALVCLDGATGKPLWRTRRPVANAWASPVVTGGRVYTCANPWVIAYQAEDGREIWRASVLEGDVAPSPVWHEGILYIANDRAVAAAIKTDGTGDVTKTHVLWSTTKDLLLPDIVSPLTDGKFLLLVHGGGDVFCLDAGSGKLLWNHRFENAPMNASPILVGSTVYLTDREGVTHVFELNGTFRELRACKLGEAVSASLASAGGRLYIRGKQNLYCIGSK